MNPRSIRLHQRPPVPHFERLLVAVCIAQGTAILGFDFALPFIPLYLQQDLGVHGLGATAIWAGVIGFGPAIPATILGPIWGRLADRYGYRAMLLRAMISAAVLLALMGLASSVWMLLVLRMIQGGLTGTVYSAQALVATAAPEEDAGRAMGLLQMSVYVGATVGPVFGGLVAGFAGYRAAFISAGLLLATATAIVLVFVQEPARRSLSRTDAGRPQKVPSLRTVLTTPTFASAVLFTVAAQLAANSQLPVLPLFIQQLLHGNGNAATATGGLLAVAGLSGAVGSYLAGRSHRRFGLQLPLVVALIGSAVLLAPQAFVHSYVLFLALRALSSLTLGGLFALVGTWAAVASPAHAKGSAFGLIGAASSLGFGAGPLLGGAVSAAVGIRPLFLMAASLLAVAALAMPLSSAGFQQRVATHVSHIATSDDKRRTAAE
jgi:DHA1 family multidrug resistance protein-like MFS transporter